MPKIRKFTGWTDPKIAPANTTEKTVDHHCHVWFRFYDYDRGKWSNPIRRKPFLSQPYSKRSHYLDLKALVKAIEYKLTIEGWNPITGEYRNSFSDLSLDEQLQKIKQFTFNQAIDFAFEKKKTDWAPRTVFAYKGAIKYLKKAAGTMDLDIKPMADFKLSHFKALLEEVRRQQKFSSKGFNKYREYLSSLVGEMIQWEILEINLVHHVKSKPVDKTFAHRPPTTNERNIIISTIKKAHPDYYRFLAVLYGCTLRPEEITRLQIKHLHIKDGVFRLPASNTKTRMERAAIIPEWVLTVLMELNLHNYNPDFYIFSTFNKYRSFLPGPNKMHVHSTQRLWKKIVKDGLGIDVSQYSLKKLAGDDMVRMQRAEQAHQLLDLPREMMGHTSEKMTGVYVTEHLEVMKELIKKKMPVL